MRKHIIFLFLLPLSITVMNAQKKATPKADPQKTFDERFTEILSLITTVTTEQAGKESGLVGSPAIYGTSYPGTSNKKLPYTTSEEYTFYTSNKWGYRAEFGKFKPGQEAAQKEMEEKITKLLLDGLAKTDWKVVTSTAKDDEKTKELLHYNKLQGAHHIRLKVSKRSSGNLIILTWD